MPEAPVGPVDGFVPIPYPPRTVVLEKLREWTFDDGVQGWKALHHCLVSAVGGSLLVDSTGDDPYLATALNVPGSSFVIRLRARSVIRGSGQIFWTTDRFPSTEEERSARFPLVRDGEWHEYEVPIRVEGALTSLRLDPATEAGRVEIDGIAVHRGGTYPLVLERVETRPDGATISVRNVGEEAVAFTFRGEERRIEPGSLLQLSAPLEGEGPVEAASLVLEPRGLPPLRRSIVAFRPRAPMEGVDLVGGSVSVRIARDGSTARIERDGRLVAAVAPLVLAGETIPTLRIESANSSAAELSGNGLRVRVALEDDEVSIHIRSEGEIEGPVVRAIGPLEQGLFAGVEYLGKGEVSSSKLDIETEAHLRFAPDPLYLTMPLMSCVTDAGAVAVTWKDTSLRPVFASPDFLDGSRDHRMALRGKAIDATILVRRTSLEETILWAVGELGGLPPPPAPPRSRAAQLDLCLRSIQGPIAGEGGWGHCAEPAWTKHWFADMASALWRITGEVPALGGEVVPGGGHLRNDAIYFVTGRAGRWLERIRGEARNHIAAQRPDGSYAYAGPYRRGHFEDTASGICALPALRLLEIARLTGDRDALAAGLRTLEYMRRFRTPRGAQTWELSLHTPDILASAYLVGAYARGHELTGKEEYLREARRWALTGIPFVYLWSRHPIMLYATPPVYGATSWRAPLWIGLPVQWCGIVYAHELTRLAPLDRTLDWNGLARGILVAGQQMQYPDGPLLGCLPDYFEVRDQSRGGPSINPSLLVNLQLALEGEVDSLAVAEGGGHRVVSPFRVQVEGAAARIEGRAGVRYQIVVDGRRIVEVDSVGKDVVPLE